MNESDDDLPHLIRLFRHVPQYPLVGGRPMVPREKKSPVASRSSSSRRLVVAHTRARARTLTHSLAVTRAHTHERRRAGSIGQIGKPASGKKEPTPLDLDLPIQSSSIQRAGQRNAPRGERRRQRAKRWARRGQGEGKRAEAARELSAARSGRRSESVSVGSTKDSRLGNAEESRNRASGMPAGKAEAWPVLKGGWAWA